MGKSLGLGNILMAVMTAAVVAAAVYFSGGTALVAIGWGAAAGAVSLIATSMMGQIGNLSPYNDTATTLNRSTSPVSGLPILYGGSLPHKNGGNYGGSFILTGTIVPWVNVLNENSQYLFTEHCIAMSGVEKHIEQIYIDNEPVLEQPIKSDGIVPSTAIVEKYRKYLQLEVRFGGQYTNSKSLPMQYAGSKWNNSFKGDGVVSISTVIFKDQNSMENTLLVNDNYNMQVELKGQVIRDLNDMQMRCSSNAPSQIFDYMTNTVYGMGLDPNLFDLSTFRRCAQYCEQMKYYSNGAVSYQETYKQNVEKMLQTFGGIMFVSGGKICMTLDIKSLSVRTFDENTIFGTASVTTSGSTDYYNTIDAKYKNVGNRYSEDVLRIPSDISQDDVIRSDGHVITLSRDYTWIYDEEQLAKLVNTELLKAKYSQNTISFMTSEGWDLQVWDCINISLKELNINGKYRILSKEVITAQDGIGYVNLVCVESNDGIYDGVDPGIWSPDGIINEVLIVQPPSNLNINKRGNLVSGSVVDLLWTASTSNNIRGYNVFYKRSDAANWTFSGTTSPFKLEYTLYGLDSTIDYDFAVSAYNDLGISSEKLTVLKSKPDYNFTLPAITGLTLLNGNISPLETDGGDFNFQWNNQSTEKVNGRPFAEYFKNYEIKIYNGNDLAYTFYTEQPTFNFTFDMNGKRIRKPTIGIIARGYNTGTYSAEIKLTVENRQHKVPNGYSINPGYKSLFINWNDTQIERDYAGTLITVQNTASSNVKQFNTESPQFTSFDLVPGNYIVSIAHYDIFGTDSLNSTPASNITVSGDYEFSKQDVENINSILNLDSRLSTTLNDAVQIANSNTSTVVTSLRNDLTNDYNQKISASELTLQTQITNNNSALSQRINVIDSTVGQNTANISTLNQTVVNNNNAQSQSVIQLRSETNNQFHGVYGSLDNLNGGLSTQQQQIATVNQEMSTKVDKNEANSSYTLSVNANGTVAGMRLIASSGSTQQSAIYFAADKFVVAPSTGVIEGGVAPFAISNGSVFLNNAIIANGSIGTAQISNAAITNAQIQDGAITNAKISGYITSNTWDGGANGWAIGKDGYAVFNNVLARGRIEATSGSFTGSINATDGIFRGRIEANDGYFLGTVYASKLEGDLSDFNIDFSERREETHGTGSGIDGVLCYVQLDPSNPRKISFVGGITPDDLGPNSVGQVGYFFNARIQSGSPGTGSYIIIKAGDVEVARVNGDIMNLRGLQFSIPAGNGNLPITYSVRNFHNGSARISLMARYSVFVNRYNSIITK